MPSVLTAFLSWSSVKNASLMKWMCRCCPSMALTLGSACWDDKSSLLPGALALLLNDFKCHHSEMIHCACVLNFCNDFPAFAIEQTAHSMCMCLYICAYVSHKKEDTRTKSALLFSNELRSPAVSFSSWREQLDTDGTVGSRIVRHSG